MPLKSTYKPSPGLAVLPPGWTEHKAPSGHTYYYNADTKESTYQRPGAATEPTVQTDQSQLFSPYASAPSLADPNVANAYLAQFHKAPQPHSRSGHGGQGRGGFDNRPKPAPTDKPRRKEPIPGCEPWILVYTKYSRRFVYNPAKNASYWRIPEKLMPAILEMDKDRIRNKADVEGKVEEEESNEKPTPVVTAPSIATGGDSSEYEEVEVTDDELDPENDDQEHLAKRQRTGDGAAEEEEQGEGGPVEFTEADIAAQLQAMGQDYGLEPGDFDDGDIENWPEGAEGLEFSQQDAKLLFKDLLDDFNINPYSPWEKLLEEGKIIEDPRYTALSTTTTRRNCWDEWSRERIAELKVRRAQQEKKDPKVGYLALLQTKATPKLYWAEFKRKYRKEESMKDMGLQDKEREKLYRDYISRLKLPQATLKSDLMALLRAQPVQVLNNKSLSMGLPSQILGDVKYISLEPTIRDPLIEAYVQSLPAPSEGQATADESEGSRKMQEAKEKREKALQEHNRMVDEQKRQRERELAASKARLRDEERQLEMAMRVGKRGLQGQLAEMGLNQEGQETSK